MNLKRLRASEPVTIQSLAVNFDIKDLEAILDEDF